MLKRFFLVLFLVFIIAGTVFSQKQHKHQSGDMLIGFDFGLGVTTNLFEVFSETDSFPRGNYAFMGEAGVRIDYYLFYWLSFSTGVMAHPGVYAFLDRDWDNLGPDTSFTDIASTPFCLTIPVAAHVNIPFLEFLYVGAGVNFNFPMFGMLDGTTPAAFGEIDTKGDFFIGVPIDIGFDFISAGKGGMRLFARLTPEFHKGGTVMPIGFIWQVFNIKVK